MKKLTKKRFIRGSAVFAAAVAVSALVLLVQTGLLLVLPLWAVMVVSMLGVFAACVWTAKDKDEDPFADATALMPAYSGQPDGLTASEVQGIYGSALHQLAESNEFLLLTRGTDGLYYVSYITDSDEELEKLLNLEL